MPVVSRKVACTHVTVSRLWGDYQCAHCSRHTPLGYVYRCTQDYGGELPPWEANVSQLGRDEMEVDEEVTPATIDQALTTWIADDRLGNFPNNRPQLKPWMEKAIAEGHYTGEQVFTLVAQAMHVKDTIRHAELGYQLGQLALRRSRSQGQNQFFLNAMSKALEQSNGKEPDRNIPKDCCSYTACPTCRYAPPMLLLWYKKTRS